MSFVPIVTPEGEPGLFHSDNIFEAMAIGEVYGYVVFFVVVVLFVIVAGVLAKLYFLIKNDTLQNKFVEFYNKIKRMF